MEAEEVKPVPSYGLLVINHAYNEGKITFHEWLELSREWALKTIEKHKEVRELPVSSRQSEEV